MADIFEDDRATLNVTPADRRRPGRKDYRNGNLIALLRDEPTIANVVTAEVEAAPTMLSADDLAPARGILIGLPIAIAMWAALISTIWYFM